MADEKIQKNQDIDEPSDVKKKGSGIKSKLILIPVILIIQAVAAYFIVFNFLIAEPDNPQKEKPKYEPVGQFFEITDFVINPAGTRGRRFLVLELSFETNDSKLLDEAESKKIRIRDALNLLLVKKTPEELLDFTYRDSLKLEILEAVNDKLQQGHFEDMYFSKFIMQ